MEVVDLVGVSWSMLSNCEYINHSLLFSLLVIISDFSVVVCFYHYILDVVCIYKHIFVMLSK